VLPAPFGLPYGRHIWAENADKIRTSAGIWHLPFDRKIVTYLNDEIASKSIYEYLENELNLKISYSRREIKFRSATDEKRRHINLENIDRVVVIDTHAYLSNGNLFQYETITYHPDEFTFTAIAKR